MRSSFIALIALLPLTVFSQRLEKRLSYTSELIRNGNYQEAELQLNRIIIKDQGIAEAYYQLSVCRYYSDFVQQALSDAQRSVHLDDDNANYWAHLGDVYYSLDNDIDAVKSWNTALLLDSTHTTATLGLVDFYIDHDSFALAENLLDNLKSFAGVIPDWHYRMALCEQGQGHFKEAISHYKPCLKANPYDELALYHLTLCYYALKDWDSTLIQSKKLIELNNQEAEYYFLRGTSHSQLGHTKEAKKDLGNAVLLDPKNREYQTALQRIGQ